MIGCSASLSRIHHLLIKNESPVPTFNVDSACHAPIHLKLEELGFMLEYLSKTAEVPPIDAMPKGSDSV